MKTYYNIGLHECESLINNYINAGGEAYNVSDGVLGLGTVVLKGAQRAFVIEEYYLNEWSSGHRIKVYYDGKLPKKYEKMIN